MISNYLLESSDYLVFNRKKEELIINNNFKGAYLASYDLEINSLEQVLEELNTYSLFGDKKVIIVKNIFSNFSDKNYDKLKKYIDNFNENNLLIMYSRKLDSRLSLVKDFKKNRNISYLKLELNLIDFVKEKLSGFDISFKDINYLISICKEDVSKLDNECEKLKVCCFKNKKITTQIIDDLVVEKLGDSSEVLFSLVNSIISKDKKKSLERYYQLKKYDIDVNSIIGLMSSQLKLIYQIKILKEEKMSNKDIVEQLNLKSIYQVNKLSEYSYLYSYKELNELIHLLADTDLKIKSGKVSSDIAMDLLLINL